MPVKQDFRPLELDQLLDTCKIYKEKGYRLDQLLPKLELDGTITLIYTFVLGEDIINFKITGIKKGETEVPSVTELYLAAFVFENEAHDLYGVNVVDNVLDFHGKFYQFAEGVEAPMTIISPEQLKAREKAAKIAAAKAARAKKQQAQKEGADAGNASSTPSIDQKALEDKLAGMDPEKAAKVRAALEAKAKKAAAKQAAAAQPENKPDVKADVKPDASAAKPAQPDPQPATTNAPETDEKGGE